MKSCHSIDKKSVIENKMTDWNDCWNGKQEMIADVVGQTDQKLKVKAWLQNLLAVLINVEEHSERYRLLDDDESIRRRKRNQ